MIFEFETDEKFRQFDYLFSTKYSAIVIKQNNKDFLVVNCDKSINIYNINDNISVISNFTLNNNSFARGLIEWNSNYLVVGGAGLKSIVNNKWEKIDLKSDGGVILSIIKYDQKKYGEVIITACKKGKIKLWVIRNDK